MCIRDRHRAAHLRQRREYRRIRRPAAVVHYKHRAKAVSYTHLYSVAYTWGLVCIVYNRTMVDEGDLEQGWGLLWDEKYAGQVLIDVYKRQHTYRPRSPRFPAQAHRSGAGTSSENSFRAG